MLGLFPFSLIRVYWLTTPLQMVMSSACHRIPIFLKWLL
jgi:hypothetical protein